MKSTFDREATALLHRIKTEPLDLRVKCPSCGGLHHLRDQKAGMCPACYTAHLEILMAR